MTNRDALDAQATYLLGLRRCPRPGTIVLMPGWTMTSHNVQPKGNSTRTVFEHDKVTAYHRGRYIDFWFWAQPDRSAAEARAVLFAAAVGPQAHVTNEIKGKEGQRVRVVLA
jgi:hypothetical protein